MSVAFPGRRTATGVRLTMRPHSCAASAHRPRAARRGSAGESSRVGPPSPPAPTIAAVDRTPRPPHPQRHLPCQQRMRASSVWTYSKAPRSGGRSRKSPTFSASSARLDRFDRGSWGTPKNRSGVWGGGGGQRCAPEKVVSGAGVAKVCSRQRRSWGRPFCCALTFQLSRRELVETMGDACFACADATTIDA